MATKPARGWRILGRLAYALALLICFFLAAYSSFKVFVKSGATQSPDLLGLPIEQARAVLADQGLNLRLDETGRYDPAHSPGTVARQEPGPRTLVKRGSTVEVVLSLGPEQVTVPDLTGKTLTSAQLTLAAAGLTLGRTVSVFGLGEPGTVVRQDPAAGRNVAPQQGIDVMLTTGSNDEVFVMPDLVSRNYDRIRPFFEHRGFRFGSVKYETYEGATPGLILRQFPLAGHPVSRADAISLVVVASPEEIADDRSGGSL
jgi:serine/threonine-protein kinase